MSGVVIAYLIVRCTGGPCVCLQRRMKEVVTRRRLLELARAQTDEVPPSPPPSKLAVDP
jgi:hypothetical protein